MAIKNINDLFLPIPIIESNFWYKIILKLVFFYSMIKTILK